MLLELSSSVDDAADYIDVLRYLSNALQYIVIVEMYSDRTGHVNAPRGYFYCSL